MATIQEVQQVNIQCECHHRHGPLTLLRPWTWDRPCRRCERMMERSNVVVVSPPPSSGAAVTVTSTSSGRRQRRRRASPVVIATTTTTQAAPPQQQAPQVVSVTPAQTAEEWQAAHQPPRYEVVVGQ